MPFGPANAPEFYTCVICNFKADWDTLFIETMTPLAVKGANIAGKSVHASWEVICVGENKPHLGTRLFIEAILIWSSNI